MLDSSNGPKVSVIINNYNYGKFLSDAISSVLNQGYGNIELILVDDGSTDDSREVAARFSGRVHCIYKENGGQASALNAGVAASTGELICFLDSDDTWSPDKVGQIVELFLRHPNVGWIRHKLTVADARLTPSAVQVPSFSRSGPFSRSAYHYLERQTVVPTSALCLRSSVAKAVFPIPPAAPGGSVGGGLSFDADAYITSLMFSSGRGGGMQRAPMQGYSLNKSLGYYRRHGQQQYTNRDHLTKMIGRQAAVGVIVSRAWSERTGRNRMSSTVFKHQLIAEYMSSGSLLSKLRLGMLAGGLAAVARMSLSAPLLALRQACALCYAFCLPRMWLDKVLRRQGFKSLVP